MSEEEIKKAEQRGYAKGYVAGKARKKRDDRSDNEFRKTQAFLQRAFLAALPACIEAQGWKRGEKPITSMDERVSLAWDIAEASLKKRRCQL